MRARLDNNATTPLDPAVREAMIEALAGDLGNPSSLHRSGREAARAVETARERTAALIGADAEEIVFTSGATEACVAAIRSGVAFGAGGAGAGRRALVVSAIEHPAVARAAERAAQAGVEVRVVGVDRDGTIDLAALDAALDPAVAMVSVMWVNNETGVIQPIAEIAARARAVGALVHTDATQAVGRAPIDARAIGVDLLSLSAHKFHGPQGAGALFVARGVPFRPLLVGGRQERGRRAGTENVPAIVGLGVAAERARDGLSNPDGRVRALRDRLEAGVAAAVPGSRVIGGGARRVDNTASLAFPGVDGEALLVFLDRAGVEASSGSACHAGSTEPSRVLTAMGIDRETAGGVIRLSLSRMTTDAEIDHALAVLPGAAANARAAAVSTERRTA